MNMKLSEDAAAAVKKYLEGQGCRGRRASSPSVMARRCRQSPITGTSAGRAKNRQVEFTVEVLPERSPDIREPGKGRRSSLPRYVRHRRPVNDRTGARIPGAGRGVDENTIAAVGGRVK